MRQIRCTLVLSIAVIACAVGAPAAVASGGPGFLRVPGLGFLQHYLLKHACSAPSPGHAACNAIRATPTTSGGQASAPVTPAVAPLLATPAPPYGPADLQSAYSLPSWEAASSPGSGKLVAIVDANNDPSAESDLAVYRAQYGLPACTTANGCFKKVSQTGSTTSFPRGNTGWGQEISLDLDMVSAICANCHILLVEASSSSFNDLAAAVNEAFNLGATQISNSYGGSEFSSEASFQSAYNHPGVDVTVSSGDSGYGAEFPAASQYVTAVGGTRLTPDSSSRGWTESVWSTSATEGAGSGCSAYIAKPSWQHDGGCGKRTVADVSAVADPATGVAVYDTYGSSGWMQFGGTSVAAPIIASVDALAGGRAGTASAPTYGSYPYANPTQFNDVTSGSNATCSVTYLCTGVVGYDGPTGIGTPNGVAPPVPPPPAPTILTAPTISGSPTQGAVLTAANGTWNNSPTTFSYQWFDCPTATTSGCTSLGAAATSSTYTVPGGYTQYVTVAVTAHNAGGFSAPSFASTEVGPIIELPPANTSPPTISGSPVQGQTLTATTGGWNNSPTGFAYAWHNCSDAVAADCSTGVVGTGPSYPVPTDYSGYLGVTVTASNADSGTPVAATAVPIGPVTAKPLQSFTLTASPTTRTTSAGSHTTYTISVGQVNGFTGPVAFTTPGLPSGLSTSFSPTSSTTKTTLTVRSTTSSSQGAHTIQITGAAAGLTPVSISVNLTLSGTCFWFC